MSTERIFGSWDSLPAIGEQDDLASLWHLLAAQKDAPNFGLSQRRHEIVPLWELFRRAKPKVVVEIGVAQGGTFAGWCHLAPDAAMLIAIDRDPNDCRPRPKEPVNPMIYNGPLRMTDQGGGIYALRQREQRVHAIRGWSYDPGTLATLDTILAGRKIDFLFHDASHSAPMFADDFRIYWPMIADDGIFAAHDIMPSLAPGCNKSEEWELIKREGDYSALYEFRSSRTSDSMGVGAIIK